MKFYCNNIKTWVLLSGFILISSCINKDNFYIRKGNKDYHEQSYQEAEKNYKKAIDPEIKNYKAYFNLANAHYKQLDIVKSDSIYKISIDSSLSSTILSDVYYNLGNSLLMHYIMDDSLFTRIEKEPQSIRNFIMKDSLSNKMNALIKESIESFKNALRNNPENDDARYNLAYAQHLLPNVPGGGEQDKQNKKTIPSEYAKKLKNTADSLNNEYYFNSALELMQEGLKIDTTVKAFQKYIQRVDEVTNIDTIQP